MQSENETVASISDYIRHMADNLTNGLILTIQQCNFIADHIEAAHEREMKQQAVHNCELRAKSRLCGLMDEIKAHRREVAELRECLKEAIREVCPHIECGNNICFRLNERAECIANKWRKVLKGANDEGK